MPIDFMIGDVVELRSGGPKMTVLVVDYTGGGEPKCSWFNSNNEFQSAIIHKDALQKTTKDKPYTGFA